MATKEKTYKEPAGPASEPLRRPQPTPKQIKFTFREAPRRYTVALIIMGVLIFLLLLAVVILAVLSSSETPRSDRGDDDLPMQGPFHMVGHKAEACRDFYVYSCKYFPRRTCQEVPAFSNGDVITEPVLYRLNDLLNSTDSGTRVRAFYESCLEAGNITLNDLMDTVHFKELLHDPTNTRSRHAMISDAIANKSVDMMMTIRRAPGVIPGDIGAEIWLDPAGFMFESYEYYADGAPKQYRDLLSAYKDFIEKVVEGMRDIPASHTVSVIADNIINYERRLLERLKAPKNDTILYERTTIGGLQQRVPLVKWLKLFQAYFPGARIATETPVYVSHPHYFAQLGSLISSTDDTTLNNYLMWRMVMKYAPHLDKRTRTLYSKFMQTLRGAADADLPEEDWWEQCVRYTSHYLGYAVGALYVETFKDKENVIEKAKEIAAKVKTASKNSVENVQWIHDKQPVKEKLEGVDIEVGYPDILTNSDRLEAYYQDLIVRLGSHLENVFEAEKFLRMKQAEQLTERGAGSPDHVWTTHPQDARAQYLYEQNRLLVPLAVLQKPVFSLDQLSSLQYGSLGSLVGTHIFKALDKKGIDMGPVQMFADNSTRRRYTEKLECLADGYPDATKDGQKIDGSRTSGEAFADVAGVRSAYQAFKDNNGDGKEGLPALDLSPEQLFFIGYAQSMCENIRDERVINANASSQSAPNKLRLLLTVQQLPEFADAFECSSDTTVRAAKNCDSW